MNLTPAWPHDPRLGGEPLGRGAELERGIVAQPADHDRAVIRELLAATSAVLR